MTVPPMATCAGVFRRSAAMVLIVGSASSVGVPTWEQLVLSARVFKQVRRHSEHTIQTVSRCVRRGPGGSSEPPEPPISTFSLSRTIGSAFIVFTVT